MAGHSKWANIKHKKAKEDAKRGKTFTKMIKEITIAAKSGGDPAANPRLRQLIDKAKDANMPQDNITRAIKKGTGELPGQAYEAIVYEGYGPGGIALIIDVLTDSKNRVASDMRLIFSRHGGNLAETGAVNWMFQRLGVIRANITPEITEEKLLEELIEFNIQDINIDEGLLTVTTALTDLAAVKQKLEALKIKIDDAEPEWIAQNPMSLDPEKEEQALTLLEKIEEHDDVQNVYTNLA